MVYRKYTTSVRSYPNQTYDRIHPPLLDDKGKPIDGHTLLDKDGFCMYVKAVNGWALMVHRVGEKIKNRDVMVNKESPTNTQGSMNQRGMTTAPAYMPSPLK